MKLWYFQKKNLKIASDTFDKNWNVSCHVAEYCHISCSKCRLKFCPHTCAKTSMPLINCIDTDVVWSMPCQTCRKCWFSLQHLFRQELSYRQQIARQLGTQYAEGIYRHTYYTVTLKTRLSVTTTITTISYFELSQFASTVLWFLHLCWRPWTLGIGSCVLYISYIVIVFVWTALIV